MARVRSSCVNDSGTTYRSSGRVDVGLLARLLCANTLRITLVASIPGNGDRRLDCPAE